MPHRGHCPSESASRLSYMLAIWCRALPPWARWRFSSARGFVLSSHFAAALISYSRSFHIFASYERRCPGHSMSSILFLCRAFGLDYQLYSRRLSVSNFLGHSVASSSSSFSSYVPAPGSILMILTMNIHISHLSLHCEYVDISAKAHSFF